jgi:hypothetical protein
VVQEGSAAFCDASLIPHLGRALQTDGEPPYNDRMGKELGGASPEPPRLMTCCMARRLIAPSFEPDGRHSRSQTTKKRENRYRSRWWHPMNHQHRLHFG